MKDNSELISNEDENRVKFFIESLCLKAEKKEEGQNKTHDYEITGSDGFYCLGEVKTLYYENESDEPRSFKNIENKLLRKIKEACNQFDSGNSLHMVPNVLFFSSNDFRVHHHRLIDYLKGLMDERDNDPTNYELQKNDSLHKENRLVYLVTR